MAWRESRPNLAKHSSYHNVSKILVVQESNVSSELNSDLVVRLCFSVTITTQEEGHYQPFIICKACVYKKSVKNELKVQMIWAADSSPGCCAKWHSSKDDVCWVFIIIIRVVEVAVLFTAFFSCLAKGLPRHFGIEEVSRMIPPSISQKRTLFQNALPPLY